MDKLVSIIIPNFNRAHLIQETFNSIQIQTYKNWEVIIIDDGSGDESEKVILEYVKNDSRFRYKRRNRLPKGAPTCRNIGIENANGEYIIFLDSDDLLAPYCIANRIKYFDENQSYDFLVFPMLAFKSKPGDSANLWNKIKDEDDLALFLAGDVLWQTTCPIWKKDAIKIIGSWNEEAQLWQDWEFHIKAIVLKLRYKKVDALPDCFIRRDEHNTRISKTEMQLEKAESKYRLFNTVYSFIISRIKLSNFQKKAFAATFLNHAQLIAVPYRNKEKESLFAQLSLGFSKKIAEYKLLPKQVAYLQLAYIWVLLFVKILKPYLLSRTLRTVVYRGFRLLLPNYLRRNNIEIFRYSLAARELEEVKRLCYTNNCSKENSDIIKEF